MAHAAVVADEGGGGPGGGKGESFALGAECAVACGDEAHGGTVPVDAEAAEGFEAGGKGGVVLFVVEGFEEEPAGAEVFATAYEAVGPGAHQGVGVLGFPAGGGAAGGWLWHLGFGL